MTVLTGRESCSFFDFVRSVTPFPLLLGCTPMIRSFASPLNLAVCLLVRFKGSREKIFSFGRLTMNEELSRIQSHKRSFEKFAGVATMIDMCWRRGGNGRSYEPSEYGMPVQCPSTEKWEECWEERDSGVFVVQSSLPGVRATQLNAQLKLKLHTCAVAVLRDLGKGPTRDQRAPRRHHVQSPPGQLIGSPTSRERTPDIRLPSLSRTTLGQRLIT